MLGGAERDMLALQARYAPTGRDIPAGRERYACYASVMRWRADEIRCADEVAVR